PLKEGIALIQPLIDLEPFDQIVTMIPWKDIETSSKFGVDAIACIKGNFHSVWGLNLYQIDVPTLIAAVNYMDAVYAQHADFRFAFLAIDMYASRVIESIPDDETAYPFRSAVARLYVKFPFFRLVSVNMLTAGPLASSMSDSQTALELPPRPKSAALREASSFRRVVQAQATSRSM
ncbi:hypothetical protein OEA41_010851, partial [Lepraria neglecta]